MPFIESAVVKRFLQADDAKDFKHRALQLISTISRTTAYHRPPPDTHPACHEQVRNEVIMKIRELAKHWEENAKGRLTDSGYAIHLDVEAAARLAAIIDMYPKRHPEELLGELIGAALEELEASFPYVKGSTVVATDEEGDPLYEDVGPTPRFLALSRRHLHDLSGENDKQKH
jgi:hypothetical protein